MNDKNSELYYAKNIAKQRKLQRNIFIGLFAFMIILFIISTTALGLACKDGRQKLSYYLDHNHIAIWGDTIIWADYFESRGQKKMNLYFSNIARQPNHDVKWDGVYIDGYFYN